MTIEFNCPHCEHAYRLKDEMAGKSAICKTCRNKILIPQPVTIPDDTPLPPTAEDIAAAEAAALAALNDDPVKAEVPAEQKVIEVECKFCARKWTVPFAKAGKNVLCPNDECRRQTKVPEPKDEGQYDWRQSRTKGPSMAKDNQPKLEGVQDAEATQQVSGKSLKEAGVLDEEIEPRPLKQKVMFVLVPLMLLAGTAFGIRSCYMARVERGEDRLIQESQEEFAKSMGALPPSEAPPEVSLCSALLCIAGGEHAVRHDDAKKLKEALDQFAKARDAIRKAPPGHARNAVGGELALAILVLGGSEQQARDQLRVRWFPEANMKVRPNERVYTVLEELRQTLSLVQGADFEFKNHLARRLTRELTKRGQALLAVELIPLALFAQPEQDEAKAIIALEIMRTDKGSELPRKVADELKGRGAVELLKGNPIPASAQTLFLALNTDKAPTILGAPAGGSISDPARYAYCGRLLLEDKPAEAIELARRPGSPEGQVRALAPADWSADPGPALDAAIPIISANKPKKEVSISPSAIARLAQIAAEKGKHEHTKQLTELLADEGLKAWARGSAVQLRILASPKEKADETWAELPDEPKKLRAGNAWGRMWVARQNTRLSGDRGAEVKTVNGWPSMVVPFGKAGVAMGLQDRDK